MKLALVALLAAVIAAPVVYVPTPSDAQVRVGSGARRDPPRRPRPPALSEAEEDRLWDARAEIETIDTQVADLQALGQSQGTLTPEQQAQVNAHAARRTALQADVTRLEAKRDRR